MFSSLQEIKVKPGSPVIPPPNVTEIPPLSCLGYNSSRYHYPSKTHAVAYTLYFLGWTTCGDCHQAKVESACVVWGRTLWLVVRNSFKKSEWKDEYVTTIKGHWGKMGLHLRERFTLTKVCQSRSQGLLWIFYKKAGSIKTSGTQRSHSPFCYRGYSRGDVEGAFYHALTTC